MFDINGLVPELIEKAKDCKTPQELLALAKAEGLELTEDELTNIAGGGDWVPCIGHDCIGFRS